jgi:hypothetical protein
MGNLRLACQFVIYQQDDPRSIPTLLRPRIMARSEASLAFMMVNSAGSEINIGFGYL